MANTGRRNDTYVLWGGPPSFYTGKVRSYLIKKGIPYRELLPSHPVFHSRILPALGFFVVPVLEAPDGSIIQDTSDIIEHLDQRFPEPHLNPSTPVQRTIATLIGAFGSEGLLRAGMHYRWSFLPEQEAFVRAEFGRVVSASRDPGDRDAAAAPLMRAMQAYLPRLGIIPDAIPAIEQSYEALLDILDAHFLEHPYVLGGRPSEADFGLMAPLFAHLARDPYPSTLMKGRAPNVFRWTERMNLAGLLDGEFPETEASYPADDAIPETVVPLLAHIFEDWGPDLLANAEQYNAWIDAHPALRAGDLASEQPRRQVHPSLGEITFTLRGRAVRAGGMPQALWHLDRALSLARALTGAARAQLDALERRTGGERVMAIALARPLRRENYVLVVG